MSKGMDRRTFLKSTAAAAMGGLLTGPVRGILHAAPQSGKVWTMKYDCYIQASAPTAQLDNWFLDTVVERAGGQIKIEKYWASSLHKVGEHLQAVRDGLSEISLISYGYTPPRCRSAGAQSGTSWLPPRRHPAEGLPGNIRYLSPSQG
jgi:TRAP-type C4-dicarboxylate transport system substrate-binding protein